MQNVTENIDVGKLLDNWDETHELTKDEALAILNCDDVCLDKLIETAYALRLKYKGKKVSIQLLTNVRSGNCSQNCAYCAQSCESQAQIEKYKRVSDEKLYGDNDLVDNKHLARHCIGLSGISLGVTFSIDTFSIPQPTNNTEPTGGVILPRHILNISITPNWISVIPKLCAIGRKIGVNISIAGVISINIPTTRSIIFINKNITTLLVEILNNPLLMAAGIPE
jgi:hypothetical protein